MKKEMRTKKITINELAIMVAKGFENTATKNDIKDLKLKIDVLEDKLTTKINATDRRIDHLAETKISIIKYEELEKRVRVLENK